MAAPADLSGGDINLSVVFLSMVFGALTWLRICSVGRPLSLASVITLCIFLALRSSSFRLNSYWRL